MPDPSETPEKDDQKMTVRRPHPSPRLSAPIWWAILAAAVVLFYIYHTQTANSPSEIDYGFFRQQLDKAKNIASVNVEGTKVYGEFKTAAVDPNGKPDASGTYPRLKQKFVTVLPPMALERSRRWIKLLRDRLKPDEYKVSEPPDNTFLVLFVYLLITVGLFVGLWFLFRKARDSFFSGGLTGGFAKSGARRYEAGDKPITFEDVAGLEGVKHDLQEVVEFPPQSGQVPAARRPRAQGRSADGSAGHGQDAAGPRGGRRGGRALLLDQRLGVHPDVRRRGRRAGPRPVQHGQGERPGHPLHRRDRRGGPPPRRRRRRRTRRARANAQPNPQRDGRLRPNRVGHRHGRHEPARRARSGPAAARTVRPPHHGRSAQLQRPPGDLPGPQQGRAAWTSTWTWSGWRPAPSG